MLRFRGHAQFPKEEEQRFSWCVSMLQQLGDAKIHEVLAKLLGPQPTQDDGVTEEKRKKKLAREHRERIMRKFQTKQQKVASSGTRPYL